MPDHDQYPVGSTEIDKPDHFTFGNVVGDERSFSLAIEFNTERLGRVILNHGGTYRRSVELDQVSIYVRNLNDLEILGDWLGERCEAIADRLQEISIALLRQQGATIPGAAHDLPGLLERRARLWEARERILDLPF
jgi:hypothetical protein